MLNLCYVLLIYSGRSVGKFSEDLGRASPQILLTSTVVGPYTTYELFYCNPLELSLLNGVQ